MSCRLVVLLLLSLLLLLLQFLLTDLVVRVKDLVLLEAVVGDSSPGVAASEARYVNIGIIRGENGPLQKIKVSPCSSSEQDG